MPDRKLKEPLRKAKLWTENGELLATYDTGEHMLMVGTKDYLARQKAKKDAK